MIETWLLCITLVRLCPRLMKAVDRPAFRYSYLSAVAGSYGWITVNMEAVLYNGLKWLIISGFFID